MRTSLISSVGICGRKSFPTKKHRNTKSSTILSKFIGNGGLGMSNSYCKYSRSTQMFRNCIITQPKSETLVRKRKRTGKRETNWKPLWRDVNSWTWYFFLWIGVSSTPFQSAGLSPGLPWHSAARWPTWPQTKHFSCCPGKVITYRIIRSYNEIQH